MELLAKLKKSANTDVGSGIKWNLVSLVSLVISGMVFQLLIAKIYNTEVLGYFNEAFAWYVAMSQLAVAGIHYSVLKYISVNVDDDQECNKIMGSSLVLVLITSIVASGLIYLVLDIISSGEGNLTIISLVNAIPALVFFSLNKVLINYYNAKSYMKEYAVFQALRNILLMVGFIIVAALRMDGTSMTLCFLISEGTLFFIILIYTWARRYFKLHIDFEWIKEHFFFGIKIMPSNLVVDLNFRTDIICLGLLGASNQIKGVYSFAIIFANGFYQLLVVIRRNINPQIAQYYSEKSFDRLDDLRDTIRKYVPMIISALSVVLVIGYILICYVIGKQDCLVATVPLAIILVSMSINSYFACFGNTLNQMGLPKYESLLNLITISTNFVLNMILITVWGIYGAAIATALSYFAFSTALYLLVKYKGKYVLKLHN